jgi:tellurite methyltransferase
VWFNIVKAALSRWDHELLMQTSINLQEWFGSIDIYLFDQLLKGRFVPGMRVLDAGCGSGRNLVYFLRSGYEVFGVDESEEAVTQTRQLAAALAPNLPVGNFRVEPVERMSFGEEANGGYKQQGNYPQISQITKNEDAITRQQTTTGEEPPANSSGSDSAGFDVVLSSAVLHFARDEQQWQAMVNEMWRVLKPGGIFFARLASTIGMDDQVRLIEGRRYSLPDGSNRFLVDAAMLQRVTAELGGEFIDPIKTTVVENMRAMTTWVIKKK